MYKWIIKTAICVMGFTSLWVNAQQAQPNLLLPDKVQRFPLYGEANIPNSKPTPDKETGADKGWLQNVSRPEILVYLPAKEKATGASVVIFPGGAYWGLTFDYEGVQQAKFFVEQGITAFVVKYRIPNDAWMQDKSIGPLQDAQQAMLFARQHASEYNLDANRVGVVGFSAGGHLASTLASHFDALKIDNPQHINLRPDFLVLIYPVISMDSNVTHLDSRRALLGEKPSQEAIDYFSNELHVSAKVPPTLLLHAVDDKLVDVKNSLLFLEALKQAGVAVDARLFAKGEHGFFLMPRERWQNTIMDWLTSNGWLDVKN